MNYIVKNIKIPVVQNPNIESALKHILGNQINLFQDIKVIRRALDTRKKDHPLYVYTLQATAEKALKPHPDIVLLEETIEPVIPKVKLADARPIIVGMGPAGLLCALAMVEQGLKPMLFDRGDKLTSRALAVENFWHNGKLDLQSNVQFGEGGAGAFSDGKLTSRAKSKYIQAVFDLLIKFGAPEHISWEALPHLGTDGIRAVVSRIREFLISQGCSFHYRSRLEDIVIENEAVKKIVINGQIYAPELLILAPGNAARDTFRMLANRGVALQPKPFAIGFRISHDQNWIDDKIYSSNSWTELLGAASYRLTAPKAGRGTYTFCMCPGGFVIAASSEAETNVTNGMSFAARDSGFANSAIVTVVDTDTYGTDLFDGMNLQAAIERQAFIKGYAAPFQTARDYLQNRLSAEQKVSCLFPASKSYQLSNLFPAQINQALKQGLQHFDQVLRGFIDQGILIAPETRTSSPLRMVRAEGNLNCLNISNLYAVGEGSGYAGGIISSAADGYRTGSRFAL
ncbi:MAG: hypothetical protein R6V77_05110 [Candidatus Cloacimonadaceae bacterium]